MKQNTITKLQGRRNQANSFDQKPGTLEIGRELVVSSDNILAKPRGYQVAALAAEEVVGLGAYRDSTYVFDSTTTASTLYRLVASTGEVRTTSGSQTVTVRVLTGGRPAQGPSTGNTWVGLFRVDDPDIADAFDERYGALFGEFDPTFVFNTLAFSGDGTTGTITQNDHRLRVGDIISFVAEFDSFSQSNAVITSVAANSYSFATTINDSDNVTVTWESAFQIDAPTNATATADSSDATFYSLVSVPTEEADPLWTEPRTTLAQKSLFWTGDYDVWKIATETGPITRAGVPPALDLEGLILPDSGAFKPNSQVAYRVVFGYQDVNGYTLLSAPSSVLTLVRNDTVDVPTADLAYAAPVLTVTSTAHGLTTGDTIYLYLLTATTSSLAYAVAPGSPAIVTVVDPNTFEIDLQTINQENLEFVTAVTFLQYGTGRSVLLEFTVPPGLPANAFYQVYRTTFSVASTVPPEPNYRLVEQLPVPAGQVAIAYVDSVDDDLIGGNAQLYTNPGVEGEQFANNPPPASADIDLFKNAGIFANVWEDPGLELAVIDPNDLAGGTILLDIVNTTSDASLRITGNAANEPVGNQLQYDPGVVAANVCTITHTNHGLATGDVILRYFDTGGAGYLQTPVTVTGANTFTVPSSSPNGAVTVAYSGLENVSGEPFFKRTISAGTVTTADAIAQTAIDFAKAVNRAGVPLRALTTSGIDDAPGKLIVLGTSPVASGSTIVASTVGASEAFAPNLTAADAVIQSNRDVNVVAASKVGEFEAVPPVYRFPVGSADAEILGIVSLRDSIIVLKEDGVFRINGDTPNNFSVTAVDNTVQCKSKNSVVRLNNSVYMLSNQGVVQVTDSGVRIISRDIENDINPLLGQSNIGVATSAVGYENERLYLLATQKVGTNSAEPEIVHCYNYLTEQWTTWEREQAIFNHAAITPQDNIVQAFDTTVRLERKDQLRTDYADDAYAVIPTIGMLSSIDHAANASIATVDTPLPHKLATGDVITWQDPAGLNLRLTTITRISDTRFTIPVTPFVTGSNPTAAWVKGRWGIPVFGSVSNGSTTFTLSALNSDVQDWLDGGFAVVQRVNAALDAVTENDVLGGHVIQAMGGSVYQFQLVNAATGTVSNQDLLISDGTQNTSVITVETQGATPQLGDAVLYGEQLIPILSVFEFDTDVYVLELAGPLFAFADDNVTIISGIPSVARTTPINGGNQGVLKYHAEMQTSFRNAASCSQVNVAYANDSNYLTQDVDWNNQLGTFRLPLLVGTWGALPWGEFPWGGALSIQREYLSGPAAVLRTFVPREGFAGTFIQIQLAHRVAGESFDLQSLSIFTQPVTARTTR